MKCCVTRETNAKDYRNLAFLGTYADLKSLAVLCPPTGFQKELREATVERHFVLVDTVVAALPVFAVFLLILIPVVVLQSESVVGAEQSVQQTEHAVIIGTLLMMNIVILQFQTSRITSKSDRK